MIPAVGTPEYWRYRVRVSHGTAPLPKKRAARRRPKPTRSPEQKFEDRVVWFWKAGFDTVEIAVRMHLSEPEVYRIFSRVRGRRRRA